MRNQEVKLIKEHNDFFREWIIEEWKHHNTVDPIYQLNIIKPEELKFEPNEEYYKIVLKDTVVGFIGLKVYNKSIYIYRFFISEEHRGKGIGTITLEKIIEKAKKENKDISLEVFGTNVAKKLYEKMGFKDRYTNMVLKINDDKTYNGQ